MLKYREEISSLATVRILAVSRFPIKLSSHHSLSKALYDSIEHKLIKSHGPIVTCSESMTLLEIGRGWSKVEQSLALCRIKVDGGDFNLYTAGVMSVLLKFLALRRGGTRDKHNKNSSIPNTGRSVICCYSGAVMHLRSPCEDQLYRPRLRQ